MILSLLRNNSSTPVSKFKLSGWGGGMTMIWIEV